MNIVKANNSNIAIPEKEIDGEIWVKWGDIQPILEEYKDCIDNESRSPGDYSLFIDTID